MIMELDELFPKLIDQKIPLRILGVSPRNFTHWKQEGIVYEAKTMTFLEEGKRKWVNLNVYEALWLLMVKELRAWNIDFNTIKQIKEYLFFTVESDFKSFKEALHEYVERKYIASIQSNYAETSPYIFESAKMSISKMSELLLDVFVNNKELVLLIKKDEQKVHLDVIDTSLPNHELLGEFKTFLKQTTLVLPLIPIFSKFFEIEELVQYQSNYGLYSKEEMMILQALENNLCKEIHIAKHSSGDITMNCTFEEEIKQEQARKLRSVLGLKQYQKINVTYRNDKHLIIQRTQKNIIKRNSPE
jgi:hypothetical protein